jgi:hypothetical protein
MMHTFDPGRIPPSLQEYPRQPGWRLAALAAKYPRLSTDREIAEKNNLEWITPGHPLFETLRLHTLKLARESFAKGACFYSVQHEAPARVDFYRARVVDGLGQAIHERLFAVESTEHGPPRLQQSGVLVNFTPADVPSQLPPVAFSPEATAWLGEHALQPFLEEVRAERLAEVDRIAAHVELSLTELLQKVDEEIGKAAAEIERKVTGAEGRLAQAENRHAELLARREHRRQEMERQRALSLQAVDRIATALVLPHPERESPEVRRLQPNPETEAIAMRVAMEYETSQGRQVYDVHEKDLGYDLTSLDLNSGELRLIEVKGIGAASGTIVLTPNEHRVAEDRRDCYWLYVVTDCNTTPTLTVIQDPAAQPWQPVQKVQHYTLSTQFVAKSVS